MTVDARGIKATFERDGVYLARDVFDAPTIDRLAADFDRIIAHLIECPGRPAPRTDGCLPDGTVRQTPIG